MKSYFAEKLGDRYELLSGFGTAFLIKETLEKAHEPLTNEQYRALANSFGDAGIRGNLDMPFIAYKWIENKKGVKWYWRLTLPFFTLYWFIFAFIVRPLKWIFTGNVDFPQTSRIIKFNMIWYNKITDRSWSE